MQRVWWIGAGAAIVLVTAAWLEREDYVTTLVQAVAWPLVILAIVLIFGEQIKEKLKGLASAEIQGNRFEFEHRVADHVNEAKKLAGEIGPVEEAEDVSPHFAELLEHANDLVEKQPKESITASFEPVKQMILDAAEQSGVVVVPSTPVYEVLSHLPVDVGENTVKAVEHLEAARKDAFRLDGPVPRQAARGYVEAAQTVAQNLTPKISAQGSRAGSAARNPSAQSGSSRRLPDALGGNGRREPARSSRKARRRRPSRSS